MTSADGAISNKVGIITVIDYSNYGNRLQNYAVQQVVKRFGLSAETIVNHARLSKQPEHPGFQARLKAKLKGEGLRGLLAFVLAKAKGAISKDGKEASYADYLRLRALKETNARAFTRKHIAESDYVLYLDSPTAGLDAQYDHFVVGSDQVWNPNFRQLFGIDFLTFASPQKRIAFSPSFGVSAIPAEAAGFYRDGLNGFAHLSAREEAGAAIIRDLTGRDALVTIDPTLMLTAEDWLPLAATHPAQPKAKYLLTYFVGQRPEACEALIADFTARHGLSVIHLNDQLSEDVYAADPAEFLGFVRDAAVLFTDSFHGVIFSVTLGTPFVTFDRVDRYAKMNSRMETLLKTLELEHRTCRGDLPEAARDQLLAADYSHVPPIVARKQREVIDYLAAAFGAPYLGA